MSATESVPELMARLENFRHFRRYYFELEYDWDKLEYLQKVFKRVIKQLPSDLAFFRTFLQQLT